MMKLNKRTSSLLMFILGVVVFALIFATFILPISALEVPGQGLMPLQTGTDVGGAIGGIAIGAGLAIGLAGVGAGLGMGTASAAALGAITEKPETFGKSILYVVFIEVIAIYGFVIAYMLIGYLPGLIS
ncbi:MAG: ATP synthase subunit C [Candidatus Thorarchaeota archaeon]